MKFEEITSEHKDLFNQFVNHPLQSFEWGEFRKKTGVRVIRRGQMGKSEIKNAYQLTVHNGPLGFKIGYLPRGDLPKKEMLDDLKIVGKLENCVYIQLEPNVDKSQITNHKSQDWLLELENWGLRKSFHPLITKYNFILDLTKNEEELLSQMHPKTRYNIKIAQKHGVLISEDNSNIAFEKYLKLTQDTTKRQGFYAHSEDYHRKMWETLRSKKLKVESEKLGDELSAHLFTAKYKGQILTTWIIFIFKDTLYYPYGASSDEFREVMANNLMAWEVIKYGKKLNLSKFDMWGALGENPDPKDPWYGFHRFKKGYGAKLVENIGSFDLVVNPKVYSVANLADKARWFYLGLRKKI